MPYRFDGLILPSTLPETNIDLDLDNMLAAVSPVHHHDLSLSSSRRPISPSVSSSSTYSLSHEVDFDIDMAFQGDEETARRLMFPSSHQSYYSQPPAMPSQQVHYTSQQTPFSHQQSWMSLPLFSQQQNSYTNTLPPNNIYSSFDTNVFAPVGAVIPPTPQATEAPFFNTLTAQAQTGVLSTTPASYSSHESSATSISPSLSRSCSPAPLTRTAPPITYAKRLPSTPQPTQSLTHSQLSSSPNSNSNLNSVYSYAIPNLATSPTTPPSHVQSQLSSSSTSNSNSLHSYGILVPSSSPDTAQTWRCAYPNCSSRALFTRGCDLRKHYNRHSKHLFCRVWGCPQSAPRNRDSGSSTNSSNGFSGANASRLGGVTMGLGLAFGAGAGAATGIGMSGGGGFSSKKDRARHEAKHNPKILCEWVGEGGERCGRRFSRVDNMKDHVRRIHRKGQVSNTAASAVGAVEGLGGFGRQNGDLGMVGEDRRGSEVGSVDTLEALAEEQWARENEMDSVDVGVDMTGLVATTTP